MNHESKIAAVEGSSFSGKTTLVKALKKTYGSPYVEDHSEFIGGHDNFPPFPPDSISDAKKGVLFFLDLEKKRSENARELADKTEGTVILDRTFFSHIVFQSAVSQSTPWVPNALEYCIDVFTQAVKDGEVVLPPVFIYLEVESLEVFKSRIAKRGKLAIDFLHDPKTLAVIQKEYREIADHYPHGSTLTIVSSTKNPRQQLDEVHTFLLRADFDSNLRHPSSSLNLGTIWEE